MVKNVKLGKEICICNLHRERVWSSGTIDKETTKQSRLSKYILPKNTNTLALAGLELTV